MSASALLAGVLESPYYWAPVIGLTVVFSAVDLLALDTRGLRRGSGFALGLYIVSWGILLGLSLPIAPVGSLWWVFPWAVRIAVVTVVVGGQMLYEAVQLEQRMTHGGARMPSPPRRKLTEAELRVAEQYDDQWQAQDRERNRESELRRNMEREHRAHAHESE